MPDLTARLRPHRHVRAILADDGGMIFDLRGRRGRWYLLTPSGALWWRHVQHGTPPADATAAVARHYGVDITRAETDFRPFTDQVFRRRLLVPDRGPRKSRPW
jgi:hypothetical protein